eukprot:TRINITY_DN1659_c0_g1_i1.p1 TRINITY_DN1659_c0_g1~~TRINITY_DN1659_c0_g1_i1.p1  ORF type:complete len:299 (-),score=71.52 TRINITY_DN1659_c0_g1_i1:142-1038(-)
MMNSKQAGVFTELIKKEERARELWKLYHEKRLKETTSMAAAETVSQPFTKLVTDPQTGQTLERTLVKKKKTIEIPTFKTVTEKYRTIEEVPATRQKEIWVKQVVPETYMKKVEVEKTREVKVPVRDLKEVEEEIDIEPPKVIEEKKEEKREERQDPKQTLSEMPKSNMSLGKSINNSNNRTGKGALGGGTSKLTTTNMCTLRSLTSNFIRPSTNDLGFRVRDCDQNGVLVSKVNLESFAEAAGLKVGDLVAYVNNKPTRNMDEFKTVLSTVVGPIYLTIRRRGVPKLILTLTKILKSD